MLGDFLAHFGGHVLAQAGGAVVRTEHGLHEHEGEGIFRRPGCALEGEGHVSSVVRIETDADIRPCEHGRVHRRLNACLGDGGEGAKVLVGQTTELGVVNGSGAGNHHAGGGIVGRNVVGQVGLREGTDVFLRAKDGPSESGALKGSGMQMVENELLLLLVDFRHLTQYDVALSLDGGRL